jgi:hypothetical protein
LLPEGIFIIDAFVPDPATLRPANNLTLRRIERDRLMISATKADLASQSILYQEIVITADGNTLLPVAQRFCWPSELDVIAQLAGMCLKQRTGGFSHETFTRRSKRHVSVYEHAR